MTVNKKVTGTASSVQKGLTCGVLMSGIVMLVGATITSKLIDEEIIAWDQTGYAVMIILIISSWIGAIVSVEKIKRRRIAVCLASGVIYLMALLCITALFFGGKYSGIGETTLLIFCGSMLAVFTCGKGKGNGMPLKSKRHTVKLNKIS